MIEKLSKFPNRILRSNLFAILRIFKEVLEIILFPFNSKFQTKLFHNSLNVNLLILIFYNSFD